MEEQELTKEELHRNAIRARLAELSAENRERRRMEAMLMRVVKAHAGTLAQQLVNRMRPPRPPRAAYRLRPWVCRLKHLVLSPFFRSYLSAFTDVQKEVRHQSSRTQLKFTDKHIRD